MKAKSAIGADCPLRLDDCLAARQNASAGRLCSRCGTVLASRRILVFGDISLAAPDTSQRSSRSSAICVGLRAYSFSDFCQKIICRSKSALTLHAAPAGHLMFVRHPRPVETAHQKRRTAGASADRAAADRRPGEAPGFDPFRDQDHAASIPKRSRNLPPRLGRKTKTSPQWGSAVKAEATSATRPLMQRWKSNGCVAITTPVSSPAPRHTMSFHEFIASAAAVKALHSRMDADQKSTVARIKDEKPEKQTAPGFKKCAPLGRGRHPARWNLAQLGTQNRSASLSRVRKPPDTSGRWHALRRWAEISQRYDNPYRGFSGDGRIIARESDCFQCRASSAAIAHSSTCTDERDNGVVVGKDFDHVGSALGLH